MSREKVQQARQLIQEKRYREARKILVTVDHPTAQEWVAKIDQRIGSTKEKRPASTWFLWTTGGVVGLILLLASFLIGRASAPIPSEYQTAAAVIQQMQTGFANQGLTEADMVSTEIAVTNAYVVETAIPGTETPQARQNVTPTRTRVASPTATITWTPLPTLAPTLTSAPTLAPPTQPPVSGWTCDCSKPCSQMSSCDEAYFQLNECGCSVRDRDNDGVPCESICPGG